MATLRLCLAGLFVVLSVASATGQITAADVKNKVGLFSKGRPASIAVDDWDTERIGLFSRLRELADLYGDMQTPRQAIPLLLSTLNDPAPEVVVSAAGTLLVVDPLSRAHALAALAAGLRSGSSQAENWALDDLSSEDPVPEDIETVLTDYVQQTSSMIRYRAVQTLGRVQTRRIPAVSRLLAQLLRDQDRDVRSSAAESLGRFGPRASGALPDLRAARERAAESERKPLDDAIAKIAEPPPPAGWPGGGAVVIKPTALPASTLATLQSQLRAPVAATRMEALRTIDRHRGGAQSLVPAIIALLNDPDPSVRYVAASVLTHVDPARAAPALPILSELLFSRAKISGGYIAEVLAFTGLGRLGEPGAKVLISALANADPAIRLNAIDGLTVSDVFPAAAVPALVRLLGDPDELIRHQAMSALAYRRVPAAQVAGPVTALLKDPAETVRYTAIAVLAMLGPGAAQAVPMIKTFTSSTDADVRFTAAAAIVAIQGGTKADVPALLGRFALASAVGSDDPEAAADMRLASLAFIRLGRDAAAAIPALTRAWGRETEPTRTYVGSALAAVDPTSAARVFAAMIETANKDDEFETIEVLYQFAVLGAIAAPAESAVAAFSTHAKPRVRDAARTALAAIRIK